MATNTKPADGALTLAEMKEFGSFSKATQRYIRRSLDVGLGCPASPPTASSTSG